MTKTKKTIDELKTERDSLALALEVEQLKACLPSTHEPGVRVLEAWGDRVDRQEHLYDTPGYSGFDARLTSVSDRKDGDNLPFWSTEDELHLPRGIGRYLLTTDESVIGALGALESYCLGDGGVVSFEDKSAPKDQATKTILSRRAAALWESFAANQWKLQRRKESMTARWRVDGELALWLNASHGQLIPDLLTIEPEWITEPDKPAVLEEHYHLPPSNWKYGIARTECWRERFVGLFAERYGERGDWEFVPERSLIWSKRNSVERVKRGVGDLYSLYRHAEQAAKLLDNTAQSAAIQAAIAYIRDHGEKATRDGVSAAAAYDTTFQRRGAGGTTKTTRTAKALPGHIVDTNGAKYAAGPVGAGAGVGFIGIVQAILRRMGSRWQMPEYMISGDASNGNYASTLVAESPFVKACEGSQQQWVDEVELPLIWRVLEWGCVCGWFAACNIHTVEDLRTAIRVQVTLPEVQVRDKAAETAARQTQYDAGILSAQTWCEEEGRDWEQEQARGAKKTEVAPAYPGLPSQSAPPSTMPPVLGQGETISEAIQRTLKEAWKAYP